MSEGLNRVMLLGNLGTDPEFRVTSSGQSVLKLRLATSETYLDRNKVRQEKVEWHQITIWGKRAEALSKFLSKGARLFVDGSLHTSSYEDRDGNKRYRTEVVAKNIILAGGQRSESRQERSEPEPGSGNGQYGDDDYGPREGDDDIPF